MQSDNVTEHVRQFYDQIGWQTDEEGYYQNARYEDLRPVSADYIHRCHLRVAQHLQSSGRFLLDAGSGPIQYPEYLEYSRRYQKRVCADLSLVALQEARRRIGDHGLFVVADVSQLPFKKDAFDGVVTLHTFHHLPAGMHVQAYMELLRVLTPGKTAIVVNGWDLPPLTRLFEAPMRLRRIGRSLYRDLRRWLIGGATGAEEEKATFVRKNTAARLRKDLSGRVPIEIYTWRSVSVRFLRTYVHAHLGGKAFLALLFWLEECFPRFFGENGQYPLIVIRKPG
jgi:hypothetical protein